MAHLLTARQHHPLASTPPHRRRRRRHFALLLVWLVIPLALIAYVYLAVLPYRATTPEQLPDAPMALVFGAGVRPDGTPSPMLADRIEAAITLYRQGKVAGLLMTGDNSRPEYNEVGAMKAYAMRQGVPADVITLDSAGLSTYESCYRARSVFGIREAILVTQEYHLPRALYTCRQLGITATGLGTPDWGVYSAEVMRAYVLREMLATLNALLEIHITQPEPRITGPYPGVP